MYGLYPRPSRATFTRRVFIPGVVSGDVTAPILSSPTASVTGSSTATVGATTDEGNGTLYAVVTVSGVAPTGVQVEAGQDNGGSAATWAGNVAVSSTGAKTLNATGLAASTAYYVHLMHRDAAGNRSNVVSSTPFTTNAAPAGVTAGAVLLTGFGRNSFGIRR